MAKAVQFSVVIFLLLTNIGIYASSTSTSTPATVTFELNNKSSHTIWICGYADDDIFTGPANYDCDKAIVSGATFTAPISKGQMDLTIFLASPTTRSSQDKSYRYLTTSSADNKDKLLIWNPTGHPKDPLYPASDRIMGLIKTKQPNNIDKKELQLK